MNWKKFSINLVLFFLFLFSVGVSGCVFWILFELLSKPFVIVVEPNLGILLQELVMTGYVLLFSFILTFYCAFALFNVILKDLGKKFNKKFKNKKH